MQPVNFEGSNFTWLGNGKDISDLPVHRDEHGVSYSCWTLSPEEIEAITQTGTIWIGIFGAQPPMMPMAVAPAPVEFAREARKVPVHVTTETVQ